jgi:hypothetical protein
MRKIGVRQFLILQTCLDKGHVWSGDVYEIYNLPLSLRSGKRAMIELRKLEAYGYLKQDYDTVGEVFRLTSYAKNLIALTINGNNRILVKG